MECSFQTHLIILSVGDFHDVMGGAVAFFCFWLPALPLFGQAAGALSFAP